MNAEERAIIIPLLGFGTGISICGVIILLAISYSYWGKNMRIVGISIITAAFALLSFIMHLWVFKEIQKEEVS